MTSGNLLSSTSLLDDYFGDEKSQYRPKDDGFHNLAIGAPSETHLRAAKQLIHEAAESFLTTNSERAWRCMQYGSFYGIGQFRETVASFLTEMYGDEVLPENVIQTRGSLANLGSITETFFRSGDTIYVEDPSFFGSYRVLRHIEGLDLQAVAVDKEGIKVDELENMLTAKNDVDNDRLFKGMVYVIPTYNNPQGICYSPERCKALIELARRHDLLIFSDDVYNMLGFGEPCKAPPRLLLYDNKSDSDYKGNVLSSGTFSKILGPGFRVGWFEASDRIVGAYMNKVIKSSGSNSFTAGLICEAIHLRLLHKHIDRLNQDYRRQVELVCSIFYEKLPKGCSFFRPKGGYFMWIELPQEYNVSDFSKLAEKDYKLIVATGESCSLTKSFKNCLRFTIAFLEDQTLRCAMEKLCDAIKAFMMNNTKV